MTISQAIAYLAYYLLIITILYTPLGLYRLVRNTHLCQCVVYCDCE